MRRTRIAEKWSTSIRRAIELGEADAAYRLTVALVRRLNELWMAAR
jgi:hypothetical protein